MFPKKKETFFHKLQQYLKQYVKISNIHGVHYLGEKRSRAEKFYWVSILLLSLLGCSMMIYKIWKKYKNNPIVISSVPELMPVHEMFFPAVTICPETKCVQSKFNYTRVISKILDEDQTVTDDELHTFHYVDILCDHVLEKRPIISSEKPVLGDDFFDIIDKVRPDFAASCTFLSPACKCEQYYIPIVTDQGICFSFNIFDRKYIFKDEVIYPKNFYRVKHDFDKFSKQCHLVKFPGIYGYPFRAFLSGADNSLEVTFAHNISETDYKCNTYLQGYRVLVHNSFDVPRLSKNYFRVPHDRAVMVAVKPNIIRTSKEVESFDLDIRNCYLTHERRLKFFKTYTQSNCQLECLTNYTLKKCGCVKFYMPRVGNTSLCATRTDYCVQTAEDEMKVEELKKVVSGSISSCDCKPSCAELTFDVEISQSDFYWQYFSTQDNEDGLQYSLMNVYFKAEQFMIVERRELYGITDLISNFGGLLGLFTGFSLISLFKIIYFLTLRIFCNNQIHNNWSGSVC